MTVFLNGDAIAEPDARGERIIDDSFLLLFNAHHEAVDFALPDGGVRRLRGRSALDTGRARARRGRTVRMTAGRESRVPVTARSILVRAPLRTSTREH